MSLALSGIGHRFADGPWLLRGVTATLEAGEVYALTGPSGSGKSTLLAIMSRQLRPLEGDVLGSERVTCVFQSPIAPPMRRVRDIAALPLLAAGEDVERAMATTDLLLERFGLRDHGDHRFCDLSGGQAQRLMLARGVASQPDVLLVDEPTAQLDPTTAATVSGVIAELAGPDTVVVVATHDEVMQRRCGIVLDTRELASAGR